MQLKTESLFTYAQEINGTTKSVLCSVSHVIKKITKSNTNNKESQTKKY